MQGTIFSKKEFQQWDLWFTNILVQISIFGGPLPPAHPTTTTTIKNLSKVLIIDEKLSSIIIDGEGLLKMFWFLKINKGHGGVNGYISMLKICDSSIVKPLSLIFEDFLRIAIS